MIFAGVLDVVEFAQGHVGVDKVRVAPHKLVPLEVAGHGNWAVTQSLDRAVLLVGVALQDAGEGIVGLLDFANDNRLEFAARVF